MPVLFSSLVGLEHASPWRKLEDDDVVSLSGDDCCEDRFRSIHPYPPIHVRTPQARHLTIDRSGVLDHGTRVQPPSGIDDGAAHVVQIDQIVVVR